MWTWIGGPILMLGIISILYGEHITNQTLVDNKAVLRRIMEKKWVLMTNDDGIEAPGFEHLVKAMNRAGIPLIAFAPSTNKSACSMQLTLGKPIDLHNRNELIEQWNLDATVGVIYSHLMEHLVIR